MAEKRDYYEVLGVPRGAAADEIKAAYRKLARANHPDLNPGDSGAEDRFKEIGEAYEVLSDPGKRQSYDRFGHSAPGGGEPGAGFGGFDDLFNVVFGQQFGGAGRRAGGPQRGQDIEVSVQITLEEAFRGGETAVKLPRVERCDDCVGTGAAPGTKAETCTGCGGSGQVRQTQSLGFMTVQNVVPCGKCGGRGQTVKDPCGACSGRGRVQRNREIKVPVPAGVDDGMQMPLTGEGQAGAHGGPAGDLYVVFAVKEHDRFEREGHDLFVELPLSYAQAALGDEVQVATLDGSKVGLTVPEGTQPGKRFLLKGHGMPDVRSPGRKGNLHCIARVVVPTRMSGEQKAALRYFAELRGEAPGGVQIVEEPKGLFGRFRKAGKGDS